jgi:translation initiation factor 5B
MRFCDTMEIRSPICTVLGHVDHGKSSLLDKIRGTAIIETEAGKITQAIGASIIPLDVIKRVCGGLLSSMKTEFTIPGLLFIDTPGHAAFTSLRKRGGSLADIAILVVDINEGFKPQTLEAVEILRSSKTPFIVAANKLDLLPGWQSRDKPLLASIKQQSASFQETVEAKLYEIVGELSKHGLQAERFDRVEDFTKQVSIIPVSAKTGDGIPELLMTITGLAQKYLEDCLECNVTGPAKGSVLEVKEERGFGTTMDVIIYDGAISVNDIIVIGGVDQPIVTKVKALLEPAALAEMRDKKARFSHVKSVSAATGVKIAAPEIDNVIAGMPLRVSSKQNVEKVKREIQLEVDEVLIETDREGIIIKADSLGSLEALVMLLREKEIPIQKASVGPITKKDLADAEANYELDPLTAVILGFNVKDESGICLDCVKIITDDVIYRLIDELEKWQGEERKRREVSELDTLVRPCKMMIMRGYIFRQNNPAVVGVDVEAGMLKVGMPVMNGAGRRLSTVKSIQQEQDNIEKAERGKQVAVALDNVTVGRQINEGDILYSAVPEEDFRRFKEHKKLLSADEVELLKEIALIMRKGNVVWGV